MDVLPPVASRARGPDEAGSPAVVLGVWDGHDAGAALVRDGRVVAAVSEERLTRVKGQGGFPRRAIADVLRLAGVTADDVEVVAVAGARGRLPARALDRRYAATAPQSIDPLSPASLAHATYQNVVARLPVIGDLERAGSAAMLRLRLQSEGLPRARLALIDHHRAHAAGAAAAIGPAAALVVTMDGYGDGVSSAIWRAADGRLDRLRADGPGSSVALLYGALTRLLGFAEGEEGKLTGLAATPRDRRSGVTAAADLSPFLRVREGALEVRRREALRVLRRERDAGADPASLARALQAPMEEVVVEVIRHHLRATGLRRLAVAGGLFANVSLNGRLAALDVDRFEVFPAMTDQGLCVGAALLAAGTPAHAAPLPSVFVGDAVPGEGPDPDAVAALLAAGAVVGVARGRMEFGPRALGRRSILFDPRDPARALRVGEALGREPFMPFAPILQASTWERAFTVPRAKVARAAREMTIALAVRPDFRDAARAAVHVDDTARPQVVDDAGDAADPWLASVLERFRERTGCPALVNTSFNRHREPIVRTPDEALTTARATRLTAVVLGDELVSL